MEKCYCQLLVTPYVPFPMVQFPELHQVPARYPVEAEEVFIPEPEEPDGVNICYLTKTDRRRCCRSRYHLSCAKIMIRNIKVRCGPFSDETGWIRLAPHLACIWCGAEVLGIHPLEAGQKFKIGGVRWGDDFGATFIGNDENGFPVLEPNCGDEILLKEEGYSVGYSVLYPGSTPQLEPINFRSFIGSTIEANAPGLNNHAFETPARVEPTPAYQQRQILGGVRRQAAGTSVQRGIGGGSARVEEAPSHEGSRGGDPWSSSSREVNRGGAPSSSRELNRGRGQSSSSSREVNRGGALSSSRELSRGGGQSSSSSREVNRGGAPSSSRELGRGGGQGARRQLSRGRGSGRSEESYTHHRSRRSRSPYHSSRRDGNGRWSRGNYYDDRRVSILPSSRTPRSESPVSAVQARHPAPSAQTTRSAPPGSIIDARHPAPLSSSTAQTPPSAPLRNNETQPSGQILEYVLLSSDGEDDDEMSAQVSNAVPSGAEPIGRGAVRIPPTLATTITGTDGVGRGEPDQAPWYAELTSRNHIVGSSVRGQSTFQVVGESRGDSVGRVDPDQEPWYAELTSWTPSVGSGYRGQSSWHADMHTGGSKRDTETAPAIVNHSQTENDDGSDIGGAGGVAQSTSQPAMATGSSRLEIVTAPSIVTPSQTENDNGRVSGGTGGVDQSTSQPTMAATGSSRMETETAPAIVTPTQTETGNGSDTGETGGIAQSTSQPILPTGPGTVGGAHGPATAPVSVTSRSNRRGSGQAAHPPGQAVGPPFGPVRGRHVCNLCGKSYSHRFGLSHRKKDVHYEPTTHSCPLCGKTFTIKSNRNRHVKTQHWV